jgi:hypothetical protein
LPAANSAPVIAGPTIAPARPAPADQPSAVARTCGGKLLLVKA